MNKIIDSITELLNDVDYFSEIASAVDLRKYVFDEIDSFIYPVGVNYLSINKSYVNDYQQAYSVLFIKWLYSENEWNLDEESIAEERWAELLKTIWIPRHHKNVNIKQYSPLEFINEVAAWLDHNEFPKAQIELFKTQHSLASLIEVIDLYACHHCFGETEKVFFICEFGCGYD
ncbi:hypothetical protein GK047_07990 [Paenibacillus sp. SYP-B3998]|uniref:Uncharacterized protein n=1 Tax=Paenibacillus sp. SYP-B3998 TaxID=2678564 RepID=A0A6G3ZV80_9BACL|nr:hypothetical protein [Paenibacillus sp. SYP-B3998]NEW05948.1 hypothetical protein [Paenibacillus sp. SYP-B3998]